MSQWDTRLDEFLRQIEEETTRHWPGCHVQVLERRLNFLKIRLPVGEELFIAIYFNAMNNRRSFSLIARGQRILGYDQVKTWHRHPVEAPEEHIPCDEPDLTLVFDEMADIIAALPRGEHV